MVAIGCLIGLLNGATIAFLKVPPFITTLGTQTIIYGISLVISDAQPIGGFQENYTKLITGRIGSTEGFNLPYLLFVALAIGLFFWFLYNKTRHGKYMYAIGGWLLAAKSGGASASLGMGYELEAIAGCTIGGVSTTGGIGHVTGVLVGVLVFELLKIVLQFLGVNPYYNYIVQGIVIVVAVALDLRKYLAKK